MSRFDHDLRFEIGFASDKGKRADNQDYAAARIGRPRVDARRAAVAALADGVGGRQGGRDAAELCVRGFFDGFFGLPASLGAPQAAARALSAINDWIVAQGRVDPERAGMATTFTALILDGRDGHCVHVGDSRLYRLRESALEQLSEDHVMGRGDLSVLRRAVGVENNLPIDHRKFSLRPHERYLLCSDGVHGGLRDASLREILDQRAAPDRTAQDLVAAALAAGSADNCTALVIDILDAPPASAEDISQTFDALPISVLPEIGAVVDAFRIDALLSDGRYARLLRAEDLRTSQTVVLKFPKPAVADDEVFRRAFINEAFVASRVRSPWIAETIELPPERQTRLYSVMPFYEGETLETRLRREPPISLEDGALLATRMARAIATLHRAGVIHRDIKPENILLLRDGGIKLLDLGVARLPQLDDFPDIHAPGTPSYMAPEFFAGAQGDEATDLFALGVTVYRLFTRAYPFGEIEPFTKPRFGKPASLTAKRPDLPAWLEGAIFKAIAVDPAKRHADVLEFAFEIENGARRGGPAVARKTPLYERNPLLFWQGLCALLAILLAVSLFRR
ncbi:serine/threonine protein phosphatase PrpC [Rhodoblastus acidophilus]|uniref:bifunctional protein-serine/threonine kinase/phosphatase n=1 Tax=Rhodoblastus acidophilus TaxID=1074 RepID=UPI0022243B06|nr:bifunctional protein-serine/threonine kinase/phosphatase [Rhodoblastus acidophilus]MCW2283251.1 serine/threonine protein phosphatase PrpC [Rhodoblastus acidophilus]MCW2332111.1 serine/threonine protein phosphatase PrpC [Rhodoblastus acidophilus]